MKERPILFSAPMVQAILAGMKTQTRRILKHQPRGEFTDSLITDLGFKSSIGWSWAGFGNPEDPVYCKCPYGQPGSRLWVRETFCPYPGQENPRIYYRATDEKAHDRAKENTKLPLHLYNWKPSIFMPRWASRINLEIVCIRVERLQDISEADAISEGLSVISKDGGRTIKYGIPDKDGLPGKTDIGWSWQEWQVNPIKAYMHLWNKINGPGSWGANPYVWVIEFRRIER